GLLTGKYRNLEDFGDVDRAGRLSAYANEDGLHLVEGLVTVASDLDAAPASVALAWLVAKGVTAPIASASGVDPLEALVAAPKLQLPDEHMAALETASEPYL